MPATVLVVGSLNADLVATVRHLPLPGETVIAHHHAWTAGGKGANQAVAARGTGVPVLMAGTLGDDEAGRAYRHRLERLGIDTRFLVMDPSQPTGQALVVTQDEGEQTNVIVVIPGANRAVQRAQVAAALDALQPGDVALFQLEIDHQLVEWAITAAAERDVQVILNLSPFTELSPSTLSAVDVVVVNEPEALRLADVVSAPPQSLVVTLGAAGASWDGDHRAGPQVPAAQVLDTTGAGDAFCGVLAAKLAQGYDRQEALDAALAAGAAAVQYVGAQPDGALFTGVRT